MARDNISFEKVTSKVYEMEILKTPVRGLPSTPDSSLNKPMLSSLVSAYKFYLVSFLLWYFFFVVNSTYEGTFL